MILNNRAAIVTILLLSCMPLAWLKCLAEPQHKSLPVPKNQWIDKYGQNKNANWPQKINDEKDLIRFDNEDKSDLAQNKEVIDRDEYQGWKSGPKLKATGFFRLEKVNDRWWFVTPSGTLFYSVGIDCIDSGHFTKVNNRSKVAFSWLPTSASKNYSSACSKGSVSFYRMNLIRKWDDKWRAEFKKRALARSRSWGFTGFGNWTDDELEKTPFPYVSMGPPTWELKSTYIEGDIADVYEDNFEKEVFRVAQKLSVHKNNPWLIGYFVDNEMPWWNLSYDVLDLASTKACKKVWLAKLKKKYANIEKLNQSWGTKAKNFDELRWPGDKATKAAEADLQEYRSEFADRFYDCWYRAIKNADPNHLVLGSRIPYPMDDVALACARHTDVLSFNHYDYDLGSEYARYYKLCGKPILIGEYDFDSLDAGLMSAYVPVLDQKQRGVGYSYYTENAAAEPYMVGTHYFQYVDEPLTGRDDGETSFNGFVSVADVPYTELVKAARATNSKIYAIHSGKLAPLKKVPLH